jgi:hypothetical protein
MRILVSGSSGTVGRALLLRLLPAGHEVWRLVRHAPAPGSTEIQWAPERPLKLDSADGRPAPPFDGVVHLAGESIVGRWTAAKKAAIRNSRVHGTRNLAEALAQAPAEPRVLISASAIGYYGDRSDELLREDSAPGTMFLSEVCRDWEAATAPAEQVGIRVVMLRFGVILSPEGGALARMLTPFRMGVGGKIGSGRQWMSWVSIQDVIGAIEHALATASLRGPVNLVAPNPVTNADFTRALAKTVSRPGVFPMPAFAARLAFGEMADELLLCSQRVSSEKLAASGYTFNHAEIGQALRDLIR